MDVRVASMEEAERIGHSIKALPRNCRSPGWKFTAESIGRQWSGPATQNGCLNLAREVAAQIGIDLKEGSTGGASDGNFTAALGIPTLDGLGAIGGGAHAVDEWVDIESLPASAALIAGLIERI